MGFQFSPSTALQSVICIYILKKKGLFPDSGTEARKSVVQAAACRLRETLKSPRRSRPGKSTQSQNFTSFRRVLSQPAFISHSRRSGCGRRASPCPTPGDVLAPSPAVARSQRRAAPSPGERVQWLHLGVLGSRYVLVFFPPSPRFSASLIA